jgi:hypothetical protein
MSSQEAQTKLNPAIFNSIPTSDELGLLNKTGKPDYNRVRDILGYTKQDIAIATNVRFESIRFDNKIPSELIEQMTEWATAIALVHSFFKDETKTVLWFKVPNPLLGDVAPRDMIKLGRFKKLLKFIQTARDADC